MEDRVALLEFLARMKAGRRESVLELMGESNHQFATTAVDRNPTEFERILRELADHQSAVFAIEAVIEELDA